MTALRGFIAEEPIFNDAKRAGLAKGDPAFLGRAISEVDPSDHEVAGRGSNLKEIGFVFQFFNLMPTLTIQENVELPLLLAHSSKTEGSRVQTLLEYVGLWNRAQSFPAELSGGEMQRIAIARALVHQPVILLADEPTGNLDSENGQKIIELMKRAATDFNTTVILVTHNPQIAEFGNRHFEIRDGKLTDI